MSEGGNDTVGNPHRAQISQFELFELILLLKLETVPCRAIRGNIISVNSTLPPSEEGRKGEERELVVSLSMRFRDVTTKRSVRAT